MEVNGLGAFELVTLFLGLIVFVFFLSHRRLKDELPYSKILIAGFLFFLLSWTFTNLEHLIWYDVLNLLEHISQLMGGLFLAVWSWMVFGKGDEKR